MIDLGELRELLAPAVTFGWGLIAFLSRPFLKPSDVLLVLKFQV